MPITVVLKVKSLPVNGTLLDAMTGDARDIWQMCIHSGKYLL